LAEIILNERDHETICRLVRTTRQYLEAGDLRNQVMYIGMACAGQIDRFLGHRALGNHHAINLAEISQAPTGEARVFVNHVLLPNHQELTRLMLDLLNSRNENTPDVNMGGRNLG
jgi:hypothetical protein